MFDVVPYKKNCAYVQSNQRNPIEWQVVTFRKGKWHAQTHPFRCREYFNDIVAKKHKRVYTVYGFNASPVRHKKDGIDVLIHNIKDMDRFMDNLEMLDDKVFEQLGQRLTFTVDTDDLTKLIIKFPPKCWDNTYTISALTIAIRASNYDTTFDSWEDIWKDNGVVHAFENLYDHPRAKVSSWGLLPPEHGRCYWWYSGSVFNSLNKKGTAHMLHNCGVVTWCTYLPISQPSTENVNAL